MSGKGISLSDDVTCACAEISDFGIIGMGDPDQRDTRFFETVEHLKDHGGRQWWLYLSRCSACEQGWVVAQDERIHDNFYLKRASQAMIEGILERNEWPSDFLRFEDVIRLGPDNGRVAHFFYPSDLTDSVKELIEDRADISATEIAYLLCLSTSQASKLMHDARKTSWAKLRPFA